jgi:uncharacterized protein YjbJ (UPF0337 family)
MGELKDKIKGKLIKTEGQVTDDKLREAQGQAIEKKGEIKGAIDRAVDKVEQKIDDVKRDAQSDKPRDVDRE